MNTKKAITITAIAIALTGLITGAIFLAKKTGFKPKTLQTNAYYNVNSYNYADETLAIVGQPTQYNCSFFENSGVPSLAYFEYTINYDEVLEIQIRMKGFYYIDPEQNLYTVNQKGFTNTISASNYEQISINDIDTIYIYQTEFIYHVGEGATRIDVKWQIRYGQNGNQVLTINSGGIIVNEEFYLDDVETGYLAEVIDVDNIINNLDNQYLTGYSTGYQSKGDLADGNFTGIQEIMLNVLTMPFTFISQGFNVTLWEGTAYAINIGNFIKSLIAIATILFIIKMFTSGFTVIGNYTNNRSSTRLDKQQKKATIEKTKAETRRTNNLADKGK